MIRTSHGLGEDATRHYVAQLVTQQLSGDGNDFQLHPEQVLLQCPCSTRFACDCLIACTAGIHTLSVVAGRTDMFSLPGSLKV